MKLDDGLYFDFEKLVTTLKEEELSIEEISILTDILRRKKLEIKNTMEDTSVKEWLELSIPISGRIVADVYCDYYIWCKKHNITPLGKIVFSKHISKFLQLKSKVVNYKGKSIRIYE